LGIRGIVGFLKPGAVKPAMEIDEE
jgi:hypothetical protein